MERAGGKGEEKNIDLNKIITKTIDKINKIIPNNLNKINNTTKKNLFKN